MQAVIAIGIVGLVAGFALHKVAAIYLRVLADEDSAAANSFLDKVIKGIHVTFSGLSDVVMSLPRFPRLIRPKDKAVVEGGTQSVSELLPGAEDLKKSEVAAE
jgi:hypothetical protein